MKRSAATLAVALTRLHRDAALAYAAALTCALLAYLQRNDDRFVHLAGALVFCSIAGAGSALMLHARRHRELALCEEAAPLYGRELARARALVPAVVAGCGALAYWIVSALYRPFDAAFFALTIAASFAAAAAALCAGIERGAKRAIFLAMAAAAAFLCFTLCGIPAAGIAVAGAAAYAALRHYGEVIASA